MIQFLGTVLEFLAGGLDADHGHTVLVMHLLASSMLRPTAYSGVNLHDVVWAVDFDVIQIVASASDDPRACRHRFPH